MKVPFFFLEKEILYHIGEKFYVETLYKIVRKK